MASLIEELIDVLDKENKEYKLLYDLSTEKTGYIVSNDLDKLQDVVEREQVAVSRVNVLEKKRTEVASDISDVLNVPNGELTVRKLIELLKGQPTEQQKLQKVYMELKTTLNKVVKINTNNSRLINETLDMIQFEMNLAQSARTMPETANYSKGMYSDASNYGARGFDAKQ